MSDLSDRAEALRKEVAGLREDVQGLRARQALAIAGVVVVLVLIIAVGVTAYRGLVTERRVDSLCPVLALVIGGANPASRPEGAARERYELALDRMRASYEQLGCTELLVPPRTDEE